MLNIFVYAVGWILFVAGQAQNSVTSKSNGLPRGWAGIKLWLAMHAVNLCTRAFFCSLAYGFFIHTVATRILSAGFPITATAIAGVTGWASNGLLYQFFGLFPFLRIEVSDFAPPASLPQTNPGATQSDQGVTKP